MTTFSEHLTAAIATRSRDHPVWRYNDKASGRALAQSLGVAVPALYAGPAPLDKITPPDAPFVLKPVHGSSGHGVFPLTPDGGRWRHVTTGETHGWGGWRTLAYRSKANAYSTPADRVRPPWILEELIGDGTALPDDWKTFCFGGRVHVIRQCHRTAGPLRVRWYNRDWTDIGDPMPGWQIDPHLPTPHHPDTLTAAAEAVAAHVESPFIRVDLYENADGPVFGEITPHPSAGRRTFVAEWDRRLGEAWEAACSSASPSWPTPPGERT